MFDRIDEIAAKVDEVSALFNEHDRGDVVTHEAIGAILGLGPHEGRWDHVVNRVRGRVQRERGIATWPEPTVGYRLLTVKEQVEDLPRWRLKRAARQARRAKRSIEALPDAGLSMHQRRVKEAQIEALKLATSEVRRQQRVMEVLVRRPQANPRPRPFAKHGEMATAAQ